MAFAATTITVSSTADTLGGARAAGCTLRDALVVADQASNRALRTSAEPGGRRASRDCSGRMRGSGRPYTIKLAHDATYTLTRVDDFWFGPDGLPPVSAPVTIAGHGARIVRAGTAGTPPFRFLYVSGGLSGIPAGSLTLRSLTLANGLARGGSSNGSGGGAGMGGAVFDQGKLRIEQATLSANVAQGASGNDGRAGQGGGGIGANAAGSGAGGGFGGPAPGAHGGAGGARDYTRSAGGGGGFRAADAGQSGARGGRGGGAGGFGSSGDGGAGGSGDDDNGPGGSFGHGGGAPYMYSGPHGESGDGVGGGGGGGVGGGGGAGSEASGAGGGFGGGGGQASCGSGGCSAADGGFGGGGAGPGAGGGNSGSTGGFGAGSGVNSASAGGAGAGMGGAVFSLFGSVSLSDCTVAGNSAVGGPGDGAAPSDGTAGDGLGGALFSLDGSVSVRGSTIAGNVATGGTPAGGAVYSLAFGNTIGRGGATTALVSLAGSILYGNAGAGAGEDDLALNRVKGKHPNASASTLISLSIVGAISSAHGAAAAGTPITANPLLGPLQNNGGSLQTIRTGAGSPALGAGRSCDRTDELGTPRPSHGCDLGALELTAAAPG